MKKIIFLGLLVVLLPAMVFAQEKVEAPVWNVGDKWVFDREGPMEVIASDSQGYSLKFLGGIFAVDASGIAIFERSTLNVKYILEGNKRKEYRGARKKILNFPLTLGKKWKDAYQKGGVVVIHHQNYDIHETFQVVGWEDIEVRAGKFKAMKLQYVIRIEFQGPAGQTSLSESRGSYWYSPEVKNFVKCQYEKGYSETVDDKGGRQDWQLVSYELKK